MGLLEQLTESLLLWRQDRVQDTPPHHGLVRLHPADVHRLHQEISYLYAALKLCPHDQFPAAFEWRGVRWDLLPDPAMRKQFPIIAIFSYPTC